MATYSEIQQVLKQPVEGRHIEDKKQGGKTIYFMSWANIANYLDHRAPGWEFTIVSTTLEPGRTPEVGQDCSGITDKHYGGFPPRLFLVGRLTINADDKSVSRDACGTEKLSKDSYGDPITSADATVLRRAAAKHGFMREMWSGNHTPNVIGDR